MSNEENKFTMGDSLKVVNCDEPETDIEWVPSISTLLNRVASEDDGGNIKVDTSFVDALQANATEKLLKEITFSLISGLNSFQRDLLLALNRELTNYNGSPSIILISGNEVVISVGPFRNTSTIALGAHFRKLAKKLPFGFDEGNKGVMYFYFDNYQVRDVFVSMIRDMSNKGK